MGKFLMGWALLIGMAAACLPLAAQAPEKASPAETSATKSQASNAKNAPAGVPDFSGIWDEHMPASSRRWSIYSFTSELPPMTDWGKAQYEAAKPSWGPRAVADSTDLVNPTTGNEVGCFPPGIPRIYTHPFPFEIIQIPGRVVQLFEFNHFTRQIYTDGPRQHAADLDPTWMGDSIGWWEGNTLVVDTVGFNEKTWLDRAGLPHSDQLHVIERLTRPSHGTLLVHIRIEDPKAYTKPWEGELTFELQPDWKLLEMICEDNVTFNELKKEGKEQ